MRRSRSRLIVLLSIAIVCLGWSAQTQSVTDWIRANAVPIKTVEAGNGFQDLQPLKKMIGDARLVSLGEATHGSREFFQMKHRMMEFLATEMGFTMFSIEANMPEAYRVNDYVVNGTGDPAQLLRGMYFWTWDTEEVLDMIKWMRAFNQSGRGHVEFTGFDMQTTPVAARVVHDFAWHNDANFVGRIDDATAQASSATTTPAGASFGVATGTFPMAAAAGHNVKFSGYIKTEAITNGYAGLWWRVDGAPGKMLAFDNMQDRGVKGTTDWTHYTIELPVDTSARNINFGMLLSGDGTAWFDDLTIEVDGRAYTDPSFALGFEAASPLGFFTGGNGYRVGLDATVMHGGARSLRMQKISGVGAPAGPDPKIVGPVWQEIIAHLDSGRTRYRASGATDRDIDWAIQNARVVLQTMQMRGNQVTRDHSMADNIKWILDENPRAKMVVWAHNGHVATGGFSYETMGATLRKMYGTQMFVFGFAFNQGSFQAIPMPMGSGTLRDMTVPPAKSGMLDAELASAGIPLFALDLRQAPAWFREKHGTRQIGAGYPPDDPFALVADLVAPDAFDAVLFVEHTTAARKNPR